MDILSIRSHWDAGRQVLVLVGDLDDTTAPTLAEALTAAVARDPAEVELDCTGLNFLDSAGIRAILDARRAATIDIYLTNVAGGPKRILELAGVHDALTHCRPQRAGTGPQIRTVNQTTFPRPGI